MNKKIYKFLLSSIGAGLPVSYHPFGNMARKFRYFCAKNIVKQIGINANIEKGAVLNENVVLGNYACVGINCLVSQGTTIGKHVMIGPNCLIYTTNHKFDKEKLHYYGNTEVKKVIIEEYAWIGARCIILPGVTIGKGSTIGAGSVVTKNVPPYSVAVGNPARVVKNLLD